MDTEFLAGLEVGRPDAALDAVKRRVDQHGRGVLETLEKAMIRGSSPKLRGAYDTLEGWWASDERFAAYVLWLALDVGQRLDVVVSQPDEIEELGAPPELVAVLYGLEGLGLARPAIPMADANSYPRTARWREALYRPVLVDESELATKAVEEALTKGRASFGNWGRLSVKRRRFGKQLVFQGGQAFHGERIEDEWSPLFGPVCANAEPGREVVATGLGSFRFHMQPASTMRNPITKEPMEVPATVLARFVAAPLVREALRIE